MKYGQYLSENIAHEYGSDAYLDYKILDDLIRSLSEQASSSDPPASNRQISLSTPPPTDTKGQPILKSSEKVTHEQFFNTLDRDLAKIESFTLAQVTTFRKKLSVLEASVAKLKNSESSSTVNTSIQQEAESIGEDYLRLEKYVNLNYMGFHKILKKHDKHLSNYACKTFYIKRIHEQPWVRGDFSDVVVRLSNIFSVLRGDHIAEEQTDAAGSFLRSTTKYWVKIEDVSRVKYEVLKHLPVFLQKTATGESDSQLSNSVYFDNDQLELYHGRLDKTPGAIALRLRWYGAGDPNLVFVERKTHRDTWTGEASVKERFIISESEVKQVLTNTYPIKDNKQKLITEKGQSQKQADDWETLASEIMQVIQSKQLVPTMRTQYMRTAFQIPFDATVRVSLDTNLCMISERGYDTNDGAKWHRDANQTLLNTEITRFPHAVLEIKLELSNENTTPPAWVKELQNSGLLYEVHKFSKFIHGCATLLPDYVISVPYWVDDASVRDSIIDSGAEKILVRPPGAATTRDAGVGPGANKMYQHLLPFGSVTEGKLKTAQGRVAGQIKPRVYKNEQIEPSEATKATSSSPALTYATSEDENEDDQCCSCGPKWCNEYELAVVAPTSVQKVEPKLFLANERTFLHWLHSGVTLSTIAAGILAFSEDDPTMYWAHWYAMILLPISLGFCLYALNIFLWRSERIKLRTPGRWDDPRGPILLAGSLVVVLTVNFVIKVYEIIKYY